MSNYTFIDWQNLHQWLQWKIDYAKFRIYLRDKYQVSKAYYFLGFKERENALYENLQDAGFILIFNQKPEHLKSEKKGNVDVNLTFNVMKKILEEKNIFEKVILVSWDGDYKVWVDYVIELNKFEKILAPNLKFASSLYKHQKHLDPKYFAFLDNEWTRNKIEYRSNNSKKAP
jgi:hypothetical protein